MLFNNKYTIHIEWTGPPVSYGLNQMYWLELFMMLTLDRIAKKKKTWNEFAYQKC